MIVCLLIALSSTAINAEPVRLQTAIELAQARAQGLAEPVPPAWILSGVLQSQGVAYDMTPHAEAFMNTPEEVPEQVSRQDAAADVELLFQLLRASYAGYELFGGEERFSDASEAVFHWLAQSGPSVSRRRVERSLQEALRFVVDGHFVIGDRSVMPPEKRSVLLVDDANEWYRDEQGYYRLRAGSREYLVEIDGGSPEPWLRLSISPDGELVYRMIMRDSRNLQRIPFVVRNGNQESSESAFLRGVSAAGVQRSYATYRRGSVVVQRLSQMPMPDDPAMQAFMRDAHGLSSGDLVLLDLRGNSGGSTPLIGRWFSEIAGSRELRSSYFISLNGLTAVQIAQAMSEESVELEELEQILTVVRRWHEPVLPMAGLAETPPLLVLIDGGVASSAEVFVRALARSPSVLILGTATGGVNLIGDNAGFSLPRTGIYVQYGHNVAAYPGQDSVDGSGIEPDIVLGLSALEKVFRFVEHYGADQVINALTGR